MSTRVFALLLACATLSAGCTLWDRVTSKPPGGSAHDLVSAKAYPTLIVEIDHPAGAEPDPDAVAQLKNSIMEASGRDASHVNVIQDASIPNENRPYSQSDIQALESAHRDHKTGGDTVALYILYVAGSSTEDTSGGKVLGYAYRGTSIAMFKGNIRASSSSGPLSTAPPASVIERAVLTHEFGHDAGLVNLGAPMVRNHEDTDGGQGHDPARHGHSTDPQSVMYWQVENSGGLALFCSLGGFGCPNVPYQFDADDKADLRALRES